MNETDKDAFQKNMQQMVADIRKSIDKATRPWRIRALSFRIFEAMKLEARKVNWALSRHGSMTRDVDIIAVPWTDDAVTSSELLDVLRKSMNKTIGGQAFIGAGEDGRTPGAKVKPHGRRAWTIHSTSELLVADETGAHPYVDLSIMDYRDL